MPSPLLSANDFSAVITGFLRVRTTANYTLSVQTDSTNWQTVRGAAC